MSHVAEGALHAYLDGALDEYPAAEAERIRTHLESCPECAERLEAERAIRSDAHAMLGLAAPEVDMPSLEELRAYVKRTRPQSPSGALRMYRLGWAASVVLAIGAGWMLRGGQLDPSRALDTGTFESPGEAPAAEAATEAGVAARSQVASAEAGARGREGDASVETTEGDANLVGSGPVARQAGSFGGDESERVDLPEAVVAKTTEDELTLDEVTADLASPAAGLSGTVAAMSPPPAEPEPADAVTAAFRDRDQFATTVGEPVASPASVPAAMTPPDARLDVTTDEAERARQAADAVADRSLGAADASGAGAAAAPTTVTAGAPAPAAAERPAEERPAPERAEARRAESPVQMTSALSNSGRGVAREVPDGDDRFDDEPALVVPDLDVISVTNMGDGTEPVGVMVLQALEPGVTLVVYHLEPGVDLNVLPPLDEDLNEVRVQAENGWVVMRGPRSQEELEGLLARLFPG